MCGCVAGDRVAVTSNKYKTPITGTIEHVEVRRAIGNTYGMQYFEIMLDNGELISGSLEYAGGAPLPSNEFAFEKLAVTV